MELVRRYLLAVTTAAIFCGLVRAMLGKKGTVAAIGKLLSGVFLCVTLVAPWLKLDLAGLGSYLDGISFDASAAVLEGENASRAALQDGIKARTEAYILDKADALGAKLTVEVTLTDEEIPLPCAVCLMGEVSPYAKARLTQIIGEELGIAKEAMLWSR